MKKKLILELFAECDYNEYECENKQCISAQQRCDKKRDCLDGSDEKQCGKRLFLFYSNDVLKISTSFDITITEHIFFSYFVYNFHFL